MEADSALGAVKLFYSFKGFGFITTSDGSTEVNVRSADFERDGGYNALSEGQKVDFELSEGPLCSPAKDVGVVEWLGRLAPHHAAGTRSSRASWQTVRSIRSGHAFRSHPTPPTANE